MWRDGGVCRRLCRFGRGDRPGRRSRRRSGWQETVPFERRTLDVSSQVLFVLHPKRRLCSDVLDSWFRMQSSRPAVLCRRRKLRERDLPVTRDAAQLTSL